jgi:4-hydroxythreonine-4-phosphate dehydrogenase
VSRPPDSPIAVSLGDPAGIGAEVIAKCWDNRAALGLPPFVAVGDGRAIAAVWDGPIEVVDGPEQADAAFDHALPLLQLSAAEADLPGHPSVAGAHCSLDSLEIAVGLARSGSALRWLPARSPRSSSTRSVSSIPGRPNSSPSAAEFRR